MRGARARGRDRRDLSRARPGARARRPRERADGGNARQAARAAAAVAAARCTSSTAPRRFYGGNAIVGGGLPLAVGVALADKMLGRSRVTACFFGDGAVDEGEFHESMNLAALWKLPVLFVCENNLYAMGMALERAEAETDIAPQGGGLSRCRASTVDGMDVVAVEAAARRAVAPIRDLGGPTSWNAGPIGSAPIRCSTPSSIGPRRRSRRGAQGADRPLSQTGCDDNHAASPARRSPRSRPRSTPRSTRRSPSPRPARSEPVEELERFAVMERVPQ